MTNQEISDEAIDSCTSALGEIFRNFYKDKPKMESNKDELIKIYREIQANTNSYIDNQIELLQVEEEPLKAEDYSAKIEELTKNKLELESKLMFLEQELEALKTTFKTCDYGVLSALRSSYTPEETNSNNGLPDKAELDASLTNIDRDIWDKIYEKLAMYDNRKIRAVDQGSDKQS